MRNRSRSPGAFCAGISMREVALFVEDRAHQLVVGALLLPCGIFGGGEGQCGALQIYNAARPDDITDMPAKFAGLRVSSGDVMAFYGPCGGYGDPTLQCAFRVSYWAGGRAASTYRRHRTGPGASVRCRPADERWTPNGCRRPCPLPPGDSTADSRASRASGLSERESPRGRRVARPRNRF